MAMDGILLIDKPADWTSFDVVAKIRGLLLSDLRRIHESRGYCQDKPLAGALAGVARPLAKRCNCRLKVGHSGTLDPFATGLLIVMVGSATKLSDVFLKKDKTYQATLCLGSTSTTGDPEGEVVPKSDRIPSLREIENTLKKFTGEILQTPPIFSAIKVNGKRAYELARAGKDVELKARKVTVYDINEVKYEYPTLQLSLSVTSGTYIRSLAIDVGAELETGAYLTSLRRTTIDNFSVEDALACSTDLSVDEAIKALRKP